MTKSTIQTSIALLAATGMKPQATIENLANDHPLDRIRQCVAHWYMNRRCVGGEFKDTPGIVLYWLMNWDISAIPEIHPNFYTTQLYLDHRTKAEHRAARKAARQTTPSSYSQPPTPTPVAASTDNHHQAVRLSAHASVRLSRTVEAQAAAGHLPLFG